jgi:diguanylate cyclase (GGDEF)-like protein/PAS domain S-box-containing protein
MGERIDRSIKDPKSVGPQTPFVASRGERSEGLSSIERQVADDRLALTAPDTWHDPYRDVPIPVYVWKKDGEDFTLAGFNKEAEALTSGRIRQHRGIRASEYLRSDVESLANLYQCFEQKTVLSREGYYEMQTTGERKYLIIQWVFAPPNLVIVHILDSTAQKRTEEENQILARFPEDSPNPIIRVGRNAAIQYANPSATALLQQWDCSIGERLPEFWSGIIDSVFNSGDSTEFELTAGASTYLMTVHAVHHADAVYIYGDDITDLKNAEEQLELSAQVFESTMEGIMLTDTNGKIISVNSAFTAITGYRAEEVRGRTPELFKSDRHDEAFYDRILRSLSREGMWQGEVWGRHKNGDVCPQWAAVNCITDKDGRPKSYVAVFNDISELKQTQARIEHQAFHDPLTGLPNRLLFKDRLDQALKRAQRAGERFAMLYLDLDRFKNVNDSLDHMLGDRLLRTVAERLKATTRSSDTFARLGGDEFVVLMSPIRAPADMFATADRVLGAFNEPFVVNEREIYLTVSIGISVYPDDGEDAVTLVRNADLAMYHAKRQGGDAFQLFSSEMYDEVVHRVQLETHLRRALNLGQLRLCYQPVVDASTGVLSGAEALLRWDHPDLGAVSPEKFIPLAEETGLICTIGTWVLEQACRQARAWRQRGLGDVHTSVNVSARQLVSSAFPNTLRRILREAGISGDALTLEITENTLMSASGQAVAMLRELKDTGVCISIDDFGTGYSSLSYLKRFPIDALKIDRSFVVDLPHDKESVAIARSILALARNLGLQVLAEGVETRSQLEFLTAEGCDRIQGFYFSRPVPADQIRHCYPVV